MVEVSKVKRVLFGTWFLWIFFDVLFLALFLALQRFFNLEFVIHSRLRDDISNVFFVGFCYFQILCLKSKTSKRKNESCL